MTIKNTVQVGPFQISPHAPSAPLELPLRSTDDTIGEPESENWATLEWTIAGREPLSFSAPWPNMLVRLCAICLHALLRARLDDSPVMLHEDIPAIMFHFNSDGQAGFAPEGTGAPSDWHDPLAMLRDAYAALYHEVSERIEADGLSAFLHAPLIAISAGPARFVLSDDALAGLGGQADAPQQQVRLIE
jgi:hypothetical protein